jgi:hypothetical protein
MSVINALFSTAFLILVAVSAAVTSCMVVLSLFDRAFRKEKGTERGRESLLDQGHGVIDQGNEDDADDDALARVHAEQMRKFGVSQSTLKEHLGTRGAADRRRGRMVLEDRLTPRRIRLRTRTSERA